MKLISATLLMLSVCALISCQQNDNEDATLGVDVKGGDSILVNAEATSCKERYSNPAEPEKDLGAISFTGPKISLDVGPFEKLSIKYIDVVLEGSDISGGRYTGCLLTGEDAEALFKTSGTLTGDVEFPNGTLNASGESVCRPRCGGVSFTDKTKPSSGTGYVYVYATEIAGEDEEEFPVEGRADFSWSFGGAR